MKRAYMDHAAATPVRPEVMAAMLPFFVERFGNPSAVYDLGSEIKAVMEEQRGKVAQLIGARSDEIIFTSSGAEANNRPIKGLALATFLKRGKHLIVSGIEHHSVLDSAAWRSFSWWPRASLTSTKNAGRSRSFSASSNRTSRSRLSSVTRKKPGSALA